MKVRAMPILLSLVMTLGILFGGWYTYQQYYVQEPIEQFIVAKPQVVLNDIQIQNEKVVVDLDFKDPDTFAKDYKEIFEYISDKTQGKKVIIQLPKQGDEMKRLWEEQYFGIAEAMEKQEYSRIPSLMEEMRKEIKLEKVLTRMDEENIYVYLKKGVNHLYAVLPLKEEVKINE